ncbi:Muscle M-line assembly protein unc-89-like protein, partial [Leptotrombidium deliense]
MFCYILSNPKPCVYWVKLDPKREIDENTNALRESTSLKNLNDTYMESKLEFTVKSHSNLGIFECRAKNGIGEDSAKVELRGSPPVNGQIKSIQQTNVNTLDVNTTFISYSPILNYKLLLRQIPSKFAWELPLTPNETFFYVSSNMFNDLFKIDNLNMKSKYGMQVIANNEFGWGNASKEVFYQLTTY